MADQKGPDSGMDYRFQEKVFAGIVDGYCSRQPGSLEPCFGHFLGERGASPGFPQALGKLTKKVGVIGKGSDNLGKYILQQEPVKGQFIKANERPSTFQPLIDSLLLQSSSDGAYTLLSPGLNLP
jgi:hypothetical protein